MRPNGKMRKIPKEPQERIVLRRIIAIMEAQDDWSADTLDEIGLVLISNGYVKTSHPFRSSEKI